MMKKWIGSLLALCLFATPWFGHAETSKDDGSEHVEHWIQQLAENDVRFSSFATAERHWRPIGTNADYELIVIGKQEDALGYFVARAEDSTLRLVEYGLGSEHLFTERPYVPIPTSNRASIYAGLQSVWVIDDRLRDAVSGEQYPSEAPLPSFVPSAAIESTDALTDVQTNKQTNSTQPSIKRGITINDEATLADSIENDENISYIAQLFDRVVIAPFSVNGYHHWEQTMFIELEDNGSRFIPVRHALQLGSFYP